MVIRGILNRRVSDEERRFLDGVYICKRFERYEGSVPETKSKHRVWKACIVYDMRLVASAEILKVAVCCVIFSLYRQV